jgi:hypothetical protein
MKTLLWKASEMYWVIRWTWRTARANSLTDCDQTNKTDNVLWRNTGARAHNVYTSSVTPTAWYHFTRRERLYDHLISPATTFSFEKRNINQIRILSKDFHAGTHIKFQVGPGSHVSHFLLWARSGIVFTVGKTQVYWPHTHLSPSSLRWRTFTWSPQIHLSGCLNSNWCEFPHSCEWVWYGDVRHRSELGRGNDWRENWALGRRECCGHSFIQRVSFKKGRLASRSLLLPKFLGQLPEFLSHCCCQSLQVTYQSF